jgi:hypothetical protein
VSSPSTRVTAVIKITCVGDVRGMRGRLNEYRITWTDNYCEIILFAEQEATEAEIAEAAKAYARSEGYLV